MNKYLISFCIIMVFGCTSIYGQLVSTNSELNAAISNASAGTIITLADKTWTDVQISINKVCVNKDAEKVEISLATRND